MSPRGRRLLGGMLVLALAGCRAAPADALRETAERGHSWIAAADLAVDLWRRGLVPSGFARVALQDTQRGLEAERARLGKQARLMKDARVEEAVRALDAASAAASRLAAAAGPEGEAVAAAREALRASDRALQSAGRR